MAYRRFGGIDVDIDSGIHGDDDRILFTVDYENYRGEPDFIWSSISADEAIEPSNYLIELSNKIKERLNVKS